MYVLVYMYAVLTIGTGIISLLTLIYNSCVNRGTVPMHCNTGENELEYELRCSLIKYPDSVIEAPHSQITVFFQRYTDRIITHQEM